MISSDPLMRRCRSSDRTDGTMRSLSPLAIRVGWVILDRSDGAAAAELLDRLQLRLERLGPDRRRGRRCAPAGA